jgi:Rrf2 family cysteine metabolism transcriptional repressor
VKISTKGKYGLQALAYMAIFQEGEPISLSTIAEKEGISENYLQQLFSSLKKGKLVQSVKGSQGGFSLMEQPKNLTVTDILRVLEGEILVVEEEQNLYDPMLSCLQETVWKAMNASLKSTAEGISLEDIKEAYLEKQKATTYMYYI